MSKKEKGFIEKVKGDVSSGTARIFDSLKEGFGVINNKIVLVSKYAIVSIVVALIASLFFEQNMIISLGSLLFVFSFLILKFHHEFFELKIKNKNKFVKNVLFLFILLTLMFFFFTFNPSEDVEINESHPIKIISSSLAFIILVFFFFQSIYLVKAGAGIKVALKSTFNFLGKYGMSAMFYVLFLVFMFALSTLPSMISPLFIIFSILLFFGSIYSMFILLYVFWKNTKG